MHMMHASLVTGEVPVNAYAILHNSYRLQNFRVALSGPFTSQISVTLPPFATLYYLTDKKLLFLIYGVFVYN